MMDATLFNMFATRNLTPIKLFLTLIAGIVLGFSLSQMLHNSKCSLDITLPFTTSGRNLSSRSGISSSTTTTTGSDQHDQHELDYANHVNLDFVAEEEVPRPPSRDDSSLADRLFNETRVLCWVLTGPKNHAARAIHVKNTWGSRCNKLIFMSSQQDDELGAINLGVGEGRGNLWHKTREATKYIYEHHFDEADWFLKADDDTYVVAENLRAFLYPFSTDAPVYFGCKFKPLVRQGYMSGGAGYVLSKEALRRFVEQAYPNSKICRNRKGGSEDKEMGNCLQNVGVVAGDSRDMQKRGRFFPTSPEGHLLPKNKSHWYWRYIYYATKDGLDCCSDYAISFHYIQPAFFYVLDYLIYRLRTFGILQQNHELPAKSNMTELLNKWRNETSDNPL